MGPFLRGFASELVKVAGRVPNEGSVDTAPRLRLGESSAPPQGAEYRPSPRYTPKADPAGLDGDKPRSGGSRMPKVKPGMPWRELADTKTVENTPAPVQPKPKEMPVPVTSGTTSTKADGKRWSNGLSKTPGQLSDMQMGNPAASGDTNAMGRSSGEYGKRI